MRLVWEVDAGFPRPLCNVEVFSLDGRFLGRPDLFDPESGVAGEYDGDHHLEVRQRSRDLGREERLRSHGLGYFTVVGGEMGKRDAVVDRMTTTRARALRSREPRRLDAAAPARVEHPRCPSTSGWPCASSSSPVAHPTDVRWGLVPSDPRRARRSHPDLATSCSPSGATLLGMTPDSVPLEDPGVGESFVVAPPYTPDRGRARQRGEVRRPLPRPGALVAEVQPPGARAGRGRAAAAAGADPLPGDLREQPGRVLHGPRGRAEAPDRGRGGRARGVRAAAAGGARGDPDDHPAS